MKFDLHIHSCYSKNLWGTKLFSPPSKSHPEDIIKTAIQRGLSIIAVTDHDNIKGSLKTLEIAKKYKDQILVIPGVEVSSKDGHILAYNVYEDIPKNLPAKETIKIIKEKGGVAVAAHPFNLKFSLKKELIHELKDHLFALEAGNSHSFKNKEVQNFVKEHNLPHTIGSDAHSLSEIGLCHGTTQEKATSIEHFLEIIKEKELHSTHTYDKRFILRTTKGAAKAFLHWKGKQFQSLFNKNVFLPYKD